MNMKIAIITPYDADNMGAMLQTLALEYSAVAEPPNLLE